MHPKNLAADVVHPEGKQQGWEGKEIDSDPRTIFNLAQNRYIGNEASRRRLEEKKVPQTRSTTWNPTFFFFCRSKATRKRHEPFFFICVTTPIASPPYLPFPMKSVT